MAQTYVLNESGYNIDTIFDCVKALLGVQPDAEEGKYKSGYSFNDLKIQPEYNVNYKAYTVANTPNLQSLSDDYTNIKKAVTFVNSKFDVADETEATVRIKDIQTLVKLITPANGESDLTTSELLRKNIGVNDNTISISQLYYENGAATPSKRNIGTFTLNQGEDLDLEIPASEVVALDTISKSSPDPISSRGIYNFACSNFYTTEEDSDGKEIILPNKTLDNSLVKIKINYDESSNPTNFQLIPASSSDDYQIPLSNDNQINPDWIPNGTFTKIYSKVFTQSWTEDTENNLFYNTLSLSEITSDDYPLVMLDLSDVSNFNDTTTTSGGTIIGIDSLEKQWSHIHRIVTDEGEIIAYADKKLTQSIPVKIICMRKTSQNTQTTETSQA